MKLIEPLDLMSESEDEEESLSGSGSLELVGACDCCIIDGLNIIGICSWPLEDRLSFFLYFLDFLDDFMPFPMAQHNTERMPRGLEPTQLQILHKG